MALGKGNAFQPEEEVISGINVAPVADICFVLLIVFMVTATYVVNPSIKVDLPTAETAEMTPRTTLAVVLTRNQRLYLNGEPVSREELRSHVTRAQAVEGDDLQAVIAADREASHGDVVELIDLIKASGVTRFALNTSFDSRFDSPPTGDLGGEEVQPVGTATVPEQE